jgi:RHS repeat-associated protein
VENRTYDNAGRLVTQTYPAAVAENITYSYDAIVSGNKGVGRLTKIADQSGTTEFTYNALGQVITDKRTLGTKVYTTGYLYNAAGNITQVTYPSGRIVIYARNSLGQVSGVTSKQNATAAVVNVATGLTYAPMSNLVTSMTHGNGLVTNAGYDLDYRLTSLTLKNGAANVSAYAYAYGDGINLTGITDQVTAANTISLAYTAANRLQTASGTWGSSSFSYDGVGNRLNDNNTVSSVTTTRLASYPASSNRMSAITQNAAAFKSFTYDGAGNITTEVRPGETFVTTYNKRNRPASVTRNAVAYASYGYNALEQLTSRSTSAPGGPTGTVHYLYDRDGHLIAEADAATGATTRDYLWMADEATGNDTPAEDMELAANDNDPIDLPLAVAEAAVLYQVHTDHLGRPIRMTDSVKATVWQASYTPWGEVQAISGTKALNLRFPGQYFQIETGYAFNWHRHYDPSTGRYTQPDPLRFVDGPSIYAYAGNSPFIETDREGLKVNVVTVGSAALGAAYAVGYTWWKYGDCATAKDYVEVAAIGALITAGFQYGGGKGIKATRYAVGNARAKRDYPNKANSWQNHHNHPIHMGGPRSGPTTRLNGSYHQRITNAFRKEAPYKGDSNYQGPLTQQQVNKIMEKVYRKNPLTWW